MSSLYGLTVNRLGEMRIKTSCWFTKDSLAGNGLSGSAGGRCLYAQSSHRTTHSVHKFQLLHLQWHNCVCIRLSNRWPCRLKVSVNPVVDWGSNNWHIAHCVCHSLQQLHCFYGDSASVKFSSSTSRSSFKIAKDWLDFKLCHISGGTSKEHSFSLLLLKNTYSDDRGAQ